ncbi:MAG: hypothetical protein WC140_01510 [Bacteroidales bacterium]
MKKLLSILVLSALVFSVSSQIQAQSKRETRLYEKSLTKDNLRFYKKFINKFPESQYFTEIQDRRDSVVFFSLDTNNVLDYYSFMDTYKNSKYSDKADSYISNLSKSDLSRDEVYTIIEKLLADKFNSNIMFTNIKIRNVETIVGIIYNNNNKFHIFKLVNTDSKWIMESYLDEDIYTRKDDLNTIKFEDLDFTNIGYNKTLVFSYVNTVKPLNETKKYDNIEYVTNLYDLNNHSVFSAMFSGKFLSLDNGVSKIEGESVDLIAYKTCPTNQMKYLLSNINANKNLIKISLKDDISDASIHWWYMANESLTPSVKFGVLNDECSIVDKYRSQIKGRVASSLYIANIIDFRGQTMVIAYNKRDKQYLLLWCEPICLNPDTDKYLSNIRFENASNLAFYYYIGHSLIKKHLSISQKRFR